jgi:hypothetical protein
MAGASFRRPVRARALPSNLTKREKQAIDYVTACGFELNAYSISFDITRARVKALIYYNRSEMQMMAKAEVDANKENVVAPARTHAPPAPPAPPRVPACSRPSHAQKQQPEKQAQKQAPPKPSKIDRNALSARGSGENLLSEAALAAQARADGAKEPDKKRRRDCAPEPTPAHPAAASRALADVCEADMQQLEVVAAGYGFPVPTTSEEADDFLEAVMGLSLSRSEGLYDDAPVGEIIGYNRLNGTNYGGINDPLPPGARAAFLIAESGWQEVTARTGKKRGRGSGS